MQSEAVKRTHHPSSRSYVNFRDEPHTIRRTPLRQIEEKSHKPSNPHRSRSPSPASQRSKRMKEKTHSPSKKPSTTLDFLEHHKSKLQEAARDPSVDFPAFVDRLISTRCSPWGPERERQSPPKRPRGRVDSGEIMTRTKRLQLLYGHLDD